MNISYYSKVLYIIIFVVARRFLYRCDNLIIAYLHIDFTFLDFKLFHSKENSNEKVLIAKLIN